MIEKMAADIAIGQFVLIVIGLVMIWLLILCAIYLRRISNVVVEEPPQPWHSSDARASVVETAGGHAIDDLARAREFPPRAMEHPPL